MRRSKLRGLFILGWVGLAALIAFLTIPTNVAIPPVGAVYGYEHGFHYTPPSQPNAWPVLSGATRDVGRFDLSATQHWTLQGRFFNQVGVDISQGTIQGQPEPEFPLRSVFSHDQMQNTVWGGATDFGILVLDNTRTGVHNYVMLELANLNAPVNMTTSFVEFTPSGGAPLTSGFQNRSGTNLAGLRPLARANMGQIQFNGDFSYVAMFNAEGHYRVSFGITVHAVPAPTHITLDFEFYIVHANAYVNVPAIENATRRGTSQEFFFNFTGDLPLVQFDQRRFDWQLQFGADTITNTDWNYDLVEIEFSDLGRHSFSASMVFPFTRGGVTTRIPVRGFSAYNWNLTVFGFEATFGAGMFTSADVTRYGTNPAAWPPIAQTNNPPVMFNSYASLRGSSHVSFRPARSSTWQHDLPFDLNDPIVTPGDYIVTLYYDHAAATLGQNNPPPFMQVFHFRIVDITDVRIQVPGGDVHHINRFMQERIAVSGSFFVFMDGMGVGAESRYSTPVIVDVSFNGGTPITLNRHAVTGQLEMGQLGQFHDGERYVFPEGVYEFTIRYGANNQAISRFNVIVDNSPIDNFDPRHNGTVLHSGDNVLVVGAGGNQQFALDLTWGLKPAWSGIEFRHVVADFFPFTHLGNAFTQSNTPIVGTQLSTYQIRLPAGGGYPLDHFTIEERHNEYGEHDGWELSESIRTSGVYVFRITDDANNESVFILVIDNTPAAFAQSQPRLPNSEINMVALTPNPIVGVGTHKLIRTEGGANFVNLPTALGWTDEVILDIWAQLAALGIFQTGGISIPIERAEWSTDLSDGNWNAMTTHHHTLTADGYYIFRSFDAFGNASYFYIFVNSDMARGVIVENDESEFTLANGDLHPDVSVVRQGGISNRQFLGYAFHQSDTNHIVDRLEVAFYPKTWEREIQTANPTTGLIETVANPNFPFAPTRLQMQTIDVRNEQVGRAVVIPINHVSGQTPAGIYVISRFFDPATVPLAWPNRDLVRNHFVIVDANPIIAAPNPQWNSGVSIQFGNPAMGGKTATHLDFQTPNSEMLPANNDRIIQSNLRSAQVILPENGTKFGNTSTKQIRFPTAANELGQATAHGTTQSFPSLNLNVALERYLGAGQFETMLTTNAQNHTETTQGTYRVSITDGSGGLRWQLFGVGGNIPNRASRSQILYELTHGGSDATFRVNNALIQTPATMQGTRHVQVTQLAPNQEVTFRYTRSDPRSFFADVVNSTVSRTRGGVTQYHSANFFPGTGNLLIPSTQNNALIHTYNLSGLTGGILDGDRITITLFTAPANVPNLIFDLHIDNSPPRVNLTRLQNPATGDTLWSQLLGAGAISQSDEADYMFSVRPNWTFSVDTGVGLDGQTFEFFELSDQSSGPHRITNPHLTIGEIVGMTMNSDDNRFFQIVERDRAGNVSRYHINVRGTGFVDSITAARLRNNSGTETNLLTQSAGITALFGTDVAITGAAEFWEANTYFQLQIGAQIFRRMADRAQHGFLGAPLVNVNNPSWLDFVSIVNAWLRTAGGTTWEGRVEIMLNNGFGGFRTMPLYQISAGTQTPTLRTSTITGTNNVLLEITNWAPNSQNPLPQIFRDHPHLFSVSVHSIRTGANYTTPMAGGQYAIMARPVQGIGADEELLITMTDMFGRIVRAEHNGRYGNHYDFNYLGNFRTRTGGGQIRYTGDERGVEVEFTTNVHRIEILRNGFDVYLGDLDWREEGNLTIVPILPRENAHDRWEVRIYSLAVSNRLVYNHVWNFYTRLPEIHWTNLSGDPLDDDIYVAPHANELNGAVVAHVGDVRGLFNPVISWTRSVNGVVIERDTLRRGASSLSLNRAGEYVVEVDNGVWTSRRYHIEITDVDNTTYRVYQNETSLVASPIGLPFNGRNIPHYFVLGNNATANNLVSEGEVGLRIVPSLNYPREFILPSGVSGRDYYARIGAGEHSTFIYALRARNNPNAAILFIAVTSVSEMTLWNTAILTTFDGNNPAAVSAGDESGAHRVFAASAAFNNNPLLVRLTNDSPSFNSHTGNIIVVDYFFDGELMGTLRAGESLRIYNHQYGAFQFVVRDWAGNRQLFHRVASPTAPATSHEYFTVVTLARPPILVNDETVVDGMVFNDRLDITVKDFSAFSVHAASQLNLHVTNISVTRNGIPVAIGNDFDRQRPFSTTLPGNYRFTVTYIYVPGITMTKTFSAQLVRTDAPVESFSFSGAPNVIVTNVTLNRANITNRFPSNAEVNVNTSMGQGLYEFTVAVAPDNIRSTPRIHQFSVLVSQFQDIRQIQAMTANGGQALWGNSTSAEVTIGFNPALLFLVLGEARVEFTHNGTPIQFFVGGTAMNYFPVTEASLQTPFVHTNQTGERTGTFRVVVRNIHGNVMFSEAFEVNAPVPTLVIFLVIGVAILVVVGIVVFFVLRNRMRVK